MRLKDRIAIVVGAGQSPGEGIGNGRATALTFGREGAKVLCVDHNLASAQAKAPAKASATAAQPLSPSAARAQRCCASITISHPPRKRST